jgi:hypothetical protein
VSDVGARRALQVRGKKHNGIGRWSFAICHLLLAIALAIGYWLSAIALIIGY